MKLRLLASFTQDTPFELIGSVSYVLHPAFYHACNWCTAHLVRQDIHFLPSQPSIMLTRFFFARQQHQYLAAVGNGRELFRAPNLSSGLS